MAKTKNPQNLGQAFVQLGRVMDTYPSIEGLTLREALHGPMQYTPEPARWALGDAARWLGWDWQIPKTASAATR